MDINEKNKKACFSNLENQDKKLLDTVDKLNQTESYKIQYEPKLNVKSLQAIHFNEFFKLTECTNDLQLSSKPHKKICLFDIIDSLLQPDIISILSQKFTDFL